MVSCQNAIPFLASIILVTCSWKGSALSLQKTVILTFLLDISMYIKQVFNNIYLQILRWNRDLDLHQRMAHSPASVNA